MPGYPITVLRYLPPIFNFNCNFSLTVVTARVYLTPIQVPVRMTVEAIAAAMVGTSAGNRIAGIYKDNGNTPVGGALVVESASDAKVGTYQRDEISIADTQVEPGIYWLAYESDEATSILMSDAAGFTVGGTLQNCYYDRGGGYGALTNPCPAITNTSLCPVLFLRVDSVYQPTTP